MLRFQHKGYLRTTPWQVLEIGKRFDSYFSKGHTQITHKCIQMPYTIHQHWDINQEHKMMLLPSCWDSYRKRDNKCQ